MNLEPSDKFDIAEFMTLYHSNINYLLGTINSSF